VNDAHKSAMDSISKAEQARREELSARVMSGELDDVNLYVRTQGLTRSENATPDAAEPPSNANATQPKWMMLRA
jgi:hypothetical protein